jgi:hypothetical protein
MPDGPKRGLGSNSIDFVVDDIRSDVERLHARRGVPKRQLVCVSQNACYIALEVDTSPPVSILIWAADSSVADALCTELREPGRELRVLEDDSQMAAAGRSESLLVAQAGPRVLGRAAAC